MIHCPKCLESIGVSKRGYLEKIYFYFCDLCNYHFQGKEDTDVS